MADRPLQLDLPPPRTYTRTEFTALRARAKGLPIATIARLYFDLDELGQLDVEQMLGGIRSICSGVGALRTHFGTAHGTSIHLPPLDPGYAVFVKQATVAAAAFLLDRHQASRPATRADDASTTPSAPRPAPTS